MHGQVQTRADKKNRNRIHQEYEIREKILLKSLNISSSENEQVHKLFYLYEGPYTIKKKVGKDTYIIISEIERKGLFHMKNMNHYFEKN